MHSKEVLNPVQYAKKWKKTKKALPSSAPDSQSRWYDKQLYSMTVRRKYNEALKVVLDDICMIKHTPLQYGTLPTRS